MNLTQTTLYTFVSYVQVLRAADAAAASNNNGSLRSDGRYIQTDLVCI